MSSPAPPNVSAVTLLSANMALSNPRLKEPGRRARRTRVPTARAPPRCPRARATAGTCRAPTPRTSRRRTARWMRRSSPNGENGYGMRFLARSWSFFLRRFVARRCGRGRRDTSWGSSSYRASWLISARMTSSLRAERVKRAQWCLRMCVTNIWCVMLTNKVV